MTNLLSTKSSLHVPILHYLKAILVVVLNLVHAKPAKCSQLITSIHKFMKSLNILCANFTNITKLISSLVLVCDIGVLSHTTPVDHISSS